MPAPITDLGEQFAHVRDLRRLAAAGDLSRVLNELDAARAREEQEYVDLTWALTARVEIDGPITAFLGEHPWDRRATCLRAARGIEQAFQVRGRGMAANVTADRFRQFWGILRAVEQDLIRLCAIEPSDPQPWHLRLVTARGLELGVGEARRRYERLAEHDPSHVAAQRQLLQQLCPKWGGTWDDAFAFVRDCVTRAQPGSMSFALIATVNLERWLDEPRHLHRSGVLDEVDAAADRLLAGPPTSRFGWIEAHSDFAVLYAIAGRSDRAAAHFRILGPALAEQPWDYTLGVRKQVESIRTAALAGVR